MFAIRIATLRAKKKERGEDSAVEKLNTYSCSHRRTLKGCKRRRIKHMPYTCVKTDSGSTISWIDKYNL